MGRSLSDCMPRGQEVRLNAHPNVGEQFIWHVTLHHLRDKLVVLIKLEAYLFSEKLEPQNAVSKHWHHPSQLPSFH